MVNPNKPFIQATIGEVADVLAYKLGLVSNGDSPESEPEVKKHYVYGLAGLMSLLSCSKATAARIKSSGVLDPAIHQTGKIIVVDVDLAMDLISAKKNVSRTRGHRI